MYADPSDFIQDGGIFVKVIWLGQNGLLFVSGKNKVLVDPYLSDSLKELDIRMERGWSINKRFLEVEPNVIVLTNSHMDHTDIATLKNYIERNKYQITLLCCESAFNIISASGIIGRYNNVLMENGSQWTHDNLVFEAVPAKTDDKTAMGVVITDNIENKKYYITSDTLYNKNIFRHIPRDIDTLFLPINGEDGCMNSDDAVRFAKEIDALHTVPVHFGMFDDVNPKKFNCEGAIIPEIYRIIPLSKIDGEFRRISLRKVLAAEERDMKIRLSEKALRVENSKIVTEKSDVNEEASADGESLTVHSVKEEISIKPVAPVKEEKVYDHLPAREAGIAYLQALMERQKAKESMEKAAPLPEFEVKAEIKEKKDEPINSSVTVVNDAKTEEPKADEVKAEEASDVTTQENTEKEPCAPDVNIADCPEIITDENLDFTSEIDYSFVENFTVAGSAPTAVKEISDEKREKMPEITENIGVADFFEDEKSDMAEEKVDKAEETQDGEENGENAPWSFDPFATDGLDGTLEIDSARGALSFETLESIQEISEEYDNVDDSEEDMEPYDDSEDTEELSITDSVEIIEDVEEAEELDTLNEEGAREIFEDGVEVSCEDSEENDADELLIYSDDEYTDKTEEKTDELAGFDASEDDGDDDMSDKIDAYIKELEKFERGDTVDFDKIEF